MESPSAAARVGSWASLVTRGKSGAAEPVIVSRMPAHARTRVLLIGFARMQGRFFQYVMVKRYPTIPASPSERIPVIALTLERAYFTTCGGLLMYRSAHLRKVGQLGPVVWPPLC